jgi:hypothetical protein
MIKYSKEWLMTVELMEFINEIDSDNASEFVESLYRNLDPHEPFLSQQNEEQEKWLYSLYQKYVEGDEDAAAEVYE